MSESWQRTRPLHCLVKTRMCNYYMHAVTCRLSVDSNEKVVIMGPGHMVRLPTNQVGRLKL